MTDSENMGRLLLRYMYAEIQAARSLQMDNLLQQSALHILRAWHALKCLEAQEKGDALPTIGSCTLVPEELPVAAKIARDPAGWEESLAAVRGLSSADLIPQEDPVRAESKRDRRRLERQITLQIGLAEAAYYEVHRRLGPRGLGGLLQDRGKLFSWVLVVALLAAGLTIYFIKFSGRTPAATQGVAPAVGAPPAHQAKNETVKLAQVAKPKEVGMPWDAPGNVLFKEWIKVKLPELATARQVVISVDNNDSYAVGFFNKGTALGSATVKKLKMGAGLRIAKVEVPEEAIKAGYDTIKVEVVEGDGAYSLGHLSLVK